MSALERRETRGIFPEPELFDWIDDIKASYDKGILTVRVPMPKATKAEAKRITVEK